MSMVRKKILIVDDEPAARAKLRDVVESLPNLAVIAEVSDGNAAIDAIAELSPDIVFLDIDMPEIDGFSVAKATEHLPYQLVFVTAHHQHALQAFETHAIDYLLKPARPSLIEKCLAKILRQEVVTLDRISGAPITPTLTLTDGGKSHVINCNHLVYIEGLGRYRRIHLTADGAEVHKFTTFLSDTTLDEFTDQLDDQAFMRVHRSHLVNLSLVTSLKLTGRRRYLILKGISEAIPVARSCVNALKTALGYGYP